MGWLEARVGLFALLVLALSAQAAAAADDVEGLIRQGVEFRREGKEREALASFNKAAAIQKTPRVLAQIALAEQALGLWVGAEAHLKEAMAAGSDPWIQKNMAALTSAREVIADHVGRLDLWGDPAGAEVLVDGEGVGLLPLGPIAVPVGNLTVTVRARGYADLTRSLDIPRGTLVRERIKLRPLTAEASASALAAGSAATAGAAQPPADATLVQSPAAPPDGATQRPLYKKWWFWTIVGAAAVGAGATALIVTSGDKGLTCDPNVPCGTW